MGPTSLGRSVQPVEPLTRRSLFAAAAGGLAAPLLTPSAFGQEAVPERALPEVIVPGSETIDTLDLRNDLFGRVTTQVYLNGQGPFRFLVDTGANRSVLTAATAARVGARPIGEREVHGVSGTKIAPMVQLDNIRCGAFEQRNAEVPILSDDLLFPADGALGMNRFAGLRLEFDNDSSTMIVKRSGHRWSGSISMPATIRFGQLVSARARVGSLSVPVIFDTGAEYGLANLAFKNAVEKRTHKTLATPVRLSNAAGPIFVDDTVEIPLLRFENCEARNVTAYIGDFHIFKLWNMIEQPALIVGMRVLRTVSRFAIDYGRKEMQFVA